LARDYAVGDRWGQSKVNVDRSKVNADRSMVNADRAETGLGWPRSGLVLGWVGPARPWTRVARWRCSSG
jgi:hypothetical protein